MDEPRPDADDGLEQYSGERSLKLLETPAEELDELVPGAGGPLETATCPGPPEALGASPTPGRVSCT